MKKITFKVNRSELHALQQTLAANTNIGVSQSKVINLMILCHLIDIYRKVQNKELLSKPKDNTLNFTIPEACSFHLASAAFHYAGSYEQTTVQTMIDTIDQKLT